jgi:FkbM family methyltransferase
MPRPLPFVLANSDHGALIVSQLDHVQDATGEQFGVGHQIMTRGSFDMEEVALTLDVLRDRRETHGDGVVAVDGGANVGVFTIEWAREMSGWGEVVAFEPQERIFYALAGNVALANLFNARACWAALGAKSGRIMVPRPNYLRPGSYGSLEMRHGLQTEFIGQPVSYEEIEMDTVQVVAVDDLALPRLDLLKLDVEGMELEVMAGARETIARLRPVLLVEWIKTGMPALADALGQLGYAGQGGGLNVRGTPL